MDVPPKVQPTLADIIHTANQKLGYTALMDVPPKVQPTLADIIHTANQKLGYTALMGVPWEKGIGKQLGTISSGHKRSAGRNVAVNRHGTTLRQSVQEVPLSADFFLSFSVILS